MKKISIFIMAMVAIMLNSSLALAFNYPDFLQGNKNLIICGSRFGSGTYVDKTSIVVQRYEPPIYQIAVNVIHVPDMDKGNETNFTVETKTYMYNLEERKMYRLGSDGEWNYVYPVGSMAQTGHEFSGEMAFYIAYNTKFYGGRKYYDSSVGRYMSPNSEWVYKKVDESNR